MYSMKYSNYKKIEYNSLSTSSQNYHKCNILFKSVGIYLLKTQENDNHIIKSCRCFWVKREWILLQKEVHPKCENVFF